MTASPRIEGPAKVTGTLAYAGDFPAADIAVVVGAAHPGRIVAIDSAAALAAPGVRAILTHANAPRLKPVLSLSGSELADLLPLQDATVRYAGQCVALVVADTLENARAAAALVAVEIAPTPLAVSLDRAVDRIEPAKKVGAGDPGRVVRGDADAALATSVHRVALDLQTAPHHHNAMEPGAIVAIWEPDGGLIVRLPTQFSHGDAMMLGQAFGFGLKDRLPRIVAQVLGGFQFDNRVRVIGTPAGGAFGGKNGNVHLLLAPMAAKVIGRPVKLVLTRRHTFAMMPFRGETRQHVALGADPDGRLTAIIHEPVVTRAAVGRFVEAAGELTPHLYACPAVRIDTRVATLDLNAPGWMRAPGAAVGSFAVESAMDALAHATGIDPLDLRLRNHADVDPATGHEWSSKSLKQCYAAAADAIGWSARDRETGARDAQGRHVGYGMATAAYPVRQLPAVARVIISRNGIVVESAAHEIGQGAGTAMAIIAAEALGVARDAVDFRYGDSALPFGGLTAGSMSTLSVGAAVAEGCDTARSRLLAHVAADRGSQLYGSRSLRIAAGRIVAPDGASEAVDSALARLSAPIVARAITGRTMGRSRYARMAFGAQFVRVTVDPDTHEIRVDRSVGAFAAGRIVAPVLARSQLIGGMIWGIGQALMEASQPDPRTGRWTNPDLGEALVPTHADAREVDAILIDENDTRGHPSGIKGLGEIGVVGVAPAIAAAVFHATGKRPLALPIRLE